MTRVAVLGAAGRMGATVSAAVASAPGLQVVAAVDPAAAGGRLGEVAAASGCHVPGPAALVEVVPATAQLDADAIDVAVDFTVAVAARENLAWCAASGVHAVCGTTGFDDSDRHRLAELFGAPGGPNCVLAPNFSVGAAVLMRCAELAAPHFVSAELLELHHDRKRDAPSGTSLELARRIDEASRRPSSGAPPERTERLVLEGARGGTSAGGTHVHSVRLPGLLAHHEAVFGSPGELLTLRHDTTDRESFMPGVLLAVREVAKRPGLTVGLGELLDL